MNLEKVVWADTQKREGNALNYSSQHLLFVPFQEYKGNDKRRRQLGCGGGGTMGEQWLLKQFSLNHPVEHIQKPKLPKLYVRVETSTSYFIIHNQFVK